jgi:hypothetical protein
LYAFEANKFNNTKKAIEKKEPQIRKIFKIILIVFAALIIAVVAFGAIVILDVAGYTATGTQTLTTKGTLIGKALVI